LYNARFLRDASLHKFYEPGSSSVKWLAMG